MNSDYKRKLQKILGTFLARYRHKLETYERTQDILEDTLTQIDNLVLEVVEAVIGEDETKPMLPQTEENISAFRRVPVRNNLREELRQKAKELINPIEEQHE